MADVLYTGAAQAVPQVSKITIDSVAASTAYKSSVNGKSATYTSAASGETTATIAAGLLAALEAATDGELRELSYELDPADSSSILVTGPADGAPFTVTTIPGANTTDAVVTNGTGPYHADNTANYSTGGLPGASDRLIFQDGDRAAGVKYALAALSTAIVAFVRRSSYLGQIGLPDVNAAGYREYRPKYLEVKTTSLTFDQSSQDGPFQNRIKVTSASASTLVIRGPAAGSGGFRPGGAGGSIVLDIYGTVSTSALECAGGSFSLSTANGQTSVLASVVASNASFFIGAAATPGDVTLNGCTGTLESDFNTLTVDKVGSAVTVGGTAACTGASTNVTVEAGTVVWKSTGTPGSSVTVGGGATFDVSAAPAPVVIDSVVIYEKGSLLDPNGRIVRPFDIHAEHTEWESITVILPTDRVMTVQ